MPLEMRPAARPHGGGPSSMSLLPVPVHPLQTTYWCSSGQRWKGPSKGKSGQHDVTTRSITTAMLVTALFLKINRGGCNPHNPLIPSLWIRHRHACCNMHYLLAGTDEEMDTSDDLMVQWFGLINQRNELVRKEADLMYRWVRTSWAEILSMCDAATYRYLSHSSFLFTETWPRQSYFANAAVSKIWN